MQRRYSTQSLINAISKRRNQTISLVVAGFTVLIGLIVYPLTCGRSTSQSLPQRAASVAQVNKPDLSQKQPPPSLPTTVKVVLAHQGYLWIDNGPLGKVTTYDTELPAGKHLFVAKIGSRQQKIELDVNEGEHYTVNFDAKGKRPHVKREP